MRVQLNPIPSTVGMQSLANLPKMAFARFAETFRTLGQMFASTVSSIHNRLTPVKAEYKRPIYHSLSACFAAAGAVSMNALNTYNAPHTIRTMASMSRNLASAFIAANLLGASCLIVNNIKKGFKEG